MKYGYFDDLNKEYVITTPSTPLPWINYLGSNEFFSLISNTAGGYAFYKDAKLRRLLRYRYNNVPYDNSGRHTYICDENVVWSPSFLPMKTKLDSYSCHHGLGYTYFKSSKNGIHAHELFFVPEKDNCEVHTLTLKNTTNEVKKIKVFSQVEFCLYDAMDDMTNFQRNYSTGEVEYLDNVIYHKTEYRERRNHYTFYSVNTKNTGFDTDLHTFLGKFNGYDSPIVVLDRESKNSLASGWAPCASFENDIILLPNEEKTLIYILGYIENKEEEKFDEFNQVNKIKAKELIEKYNTYEKVLESFNSLKLYWNKLLSNYQIKTNDEKLDRMVNIWNQYQCMVTFNMSRSASYFESGIGRGMGFRDSCQDLLGFVHIIPEKARQRIIDIASIQLEDGSTWHQYQPLDKKGNSQVGGGFNDDPLWLVLSTYSYIAETKDYSILEEMVPFNNDENNKATLLNHLQRSVEYTISHKGPHKLPLIGRADWNDCLNLNCFSKIPGESFQTCANYESYKAESVFIAGLFVKAISQLIEILEKTNNSEKVEWYKKEKEEMISVISKDGWDGEWFVRAYDAFEQKVGSKECEEGKIFIEPQGMCVIAGVGINDGKARIALDSVSKYLETKYGVVLLNPAYSKYYLNLGEVSSYPPGYKENAGIFCHNNPWVSCAEAILGNGDKAFEYYKKICPAYIEDISEIHRTEPYVYSQMIGGKDAKNFGEAKNSWLTGTAAWTFVNISQYILGIKPSLDGLVLEPCLPKEINEFEIQRYYQGKLLKIRGKRDINNPRIEINKVILKDNVLPEHISSKDLIEVYYK